MSVIDRIRKLQHHRGELAFSDERYDLNKARRARNPTKKKWYFVKRTKIISGASAGYVPPTNADFFENRK